LRRVFGNRSVPVSVEGAAPVEFEFDLGNGSPLEIYPAYHQTHRLRDARRTSQLLGGGIGGFRAETVVSLHPRPDPRMSMTFSARFSRHHFLNDLPGTAGFQA
jgi:hypothetical protein